MIDQFVNNLCEFVLVAWFYSVVVLVVLGISYVFTMFFYKGGK